MATPSNKTIEDFCRLCAVESQTGVTIYSPEGENICLEEKIINCLRIEVSRTDMLPKRVCQACSNLLEDYYQFSARAVQVQQTLSFLLSLQLRQTQQENESLGQNVKLESYIIKNELEDINIQQSNLHDDIDQCCNEIDTLLVDDERMVPSQKIYLPKKTIASTKNSNIDHIIMNNNETSSHDVHNFKLQHNFDDPNNLFPVFNNDEMNREMRKKDDKKEKNSDKKDYYDDYKLGEEWKKEYQIVCNKCDDIFSDRSSFDAHYRIMYNKEPVYTCSFCKKATLNYSTYRSHFNKHIYDGRYRCKMCDKKFCVKGMLKIHILSKHATVKPYICEDCGKGFVTESKLYLHQKKHCKNKKKEYPCLDCGKVLQTRGGLASHVATHRLGRRFMCDLCGKTFTQKINMQKHVKQHNGERPFPCDECGKRFGEKSQLARHKKFHTHDRLYQCHVCNKAYKTERCLKVHSNIHLTNRPYVCTYCGKGFLSSTKLKQHQNCHTGERPYSCKYCDKTFTNYSNWLKHVRKRHKVDHKTGLSLTKDSNTRTKIKTQRVEHDDKLIENNQLNVNVDNIEFIEMPGVDVKHAPNEQDQLMSFMSPFSMTQTQLFPINDSSFMSHPMLPL